jgi:hypothetical protein
MATYVNDLRLKEITTGDESGTWGTSTNTNLELIAEAFSYGTEAITTNADTHSTVIADGATDPGRSLYLKYTGTLDSACTITITPNTVSKLWFIENATSGSQNIIISQGSGANVTIPAGDVKAIYSDGAGSGAAMIDAFTDLNLAGTTTVAGISSSGAIVPSASDGAALGSASLEWSDLFLADAAVINLGDDQDTTLTHVADTGILLNSTRQLQFGDSGTYIHQSADGVLDLVSDTELELNATTIDMNGNLDLSGTLNGISILADATNFTDSILISQNASTGTLDAANYNTGLGDSVFAALTSGDRNTAVGFAALDALTSGQYNTAVGDSSLSTLTTQDNNTAIGRAALNANAADNNTAVGTHALLENTTGTNNTAVGTNALDACTTGGTNVAVGADALSTTTTQGGNTAVGYGAAKVTATTGVTAVGYQALIANTTGYDTVAVGTSALTANTTGHSNTAVGFNSLLSNTTGIANTAVGNGSLDSNTEGGYNVAVGYQSLDDNTEGGSNTAIGYNTLGANTTADNNTAVGSNALKLNTTGHSNVAVGVACLDANTTAIYNTAVGRNALGGATTGGYNTAVGGSALVTCSTGARNTAVGYDALDAVTTGDDNTGIGTIAGAAITTGSDNTIVGAYAANQITTGSTNTAMGYDALTRCTTGGGNSCFGKDAGDNVTTGGQNVCIGQDAGTTIAQGDYNICVGSIADVSSGTNANSITIGHNITATSSQFAFGKASNVVSNDFDTNASWSRSSDINKKTNIKNTDLGLNFINELRPVTFNWKPNNEFPKHFKDYSETENHMDTEKNMYGMIAQDVEKALDKVGHKNFGGWSEEEDGSQRLSQEMFIYPLINAVKELSAQVEELKAKLNEGE